MKAALVSIVTNLPKIGIMWGNKTFKANWIHSSLNNVNLRAVTQVVGLLNGLPPCAPRKEVGEGSCSKHPIPYRTTHAFFPSPSSNISFIAQSHKLLKQTFRRGSFMAPRLRGKSRNLRVVHRQSKLPGKQGD